MKALFFDLDGTLLDGEKKIPPSAVEALQAARARGMKVYVATGRSLRTERMLGWTTETTLFDGGVYSNGACICLDGQAQYVTIAPEAVRAAIDEAGRYPDVHLSVNGEGAIHAFNYRPPEFILGPWGITPQDIIPLDEMAVRQATKVLIFYKELVNSTRPLPEDLFLRLQARAGSLATMYLTDQGATIQLVPKESSKRAGILSICERMGYAPEEIAVFGDDLNDLEMIRTFPVSVAMGNAVAEVKAAARHVTLSNEEGGIAHALKHILHVI